ncbi:MAG: hypothetical protein ACJ756_09445, partial [Solirubrobacterales bacterium]
MNPWSRLHRPTAASLRGGRAARLSVLLGVTCAFVLAFAGSAFAAVQAPDHVSFTLEGCRLPVGATLPANQVCADAQYTTGNLGKAWNELDLVPYRITADSSGADQTYRIAAALDAEDQGHPGYDVISAPVLNASHSTSAAACELVSVSGEKIMSPGIGGIAKTRYREWEIHQAAGATCVWDYYGRLAIGSHLFPGSSLHANKALVVDATHITSSGIGAADVSIPVKEIAPQTISKDMSANQGSAYSWSVSKSSSPAEINFGNTCATTAAERQANVTVTVTWTRSAPAANGDITITTHIFATNPAARVITVGIEDKIYKGSGQAAADLLDTANTAAGGVDVPANTSNFPVLTHTKTVASGTATSFNDVATATYTDKLTGVPVVGTTTATKSANLVIDNNATSSSATISDTEQITGTGLTFSSDSPAGGSFSGYTAGDHTTGPITWTSDTVSGSGSVTFHKTVYLDSPQATTGQLSDTANVNLIGQLQAAATASAHTDISATLACGQITITKDADPNDAQDFGFTASTLQSTTIDPFALDDDSNATLPNTRTFSGLKPGSYDVSEDANPAGWDLTGLSCDDDSTQDPATRTATIALPAGGDVSCTFTNTQRGTIIVEKQTLPDGSAATFGFSGDAAGTLSDGQQITVNNLVPGTYS